jgi:SAM-dependent methyltransferase
VQVDIDPAAARRAEYIRRAILAYRPATVLDAGCGRGFYLRLLHELPGIREIYGVDTNETYLRAAAQHVRSERVGLARADITDLPFPDGRFDLVICSEVLEHVRDDDRALEELARVIRPGGHLVITVPHRTFPLAWDPLNWFLMRVWGTHVPARHWWLAGIWADHERLYNVRELRRLAGLWRFEVVDLRLAVRRCWPFSHFLLYGVGKNLVERCGLRRFDRFGPRLSAPARALAWLMCWPDRARPAAPEGSVAVNILAVLRAKTPPTSTPCG